MVIERLFIKEGIKEFQVEEFLAEKFERSGYSHTEIQRTPLGTRIVVYVNRPGLVIGRSGRQIKELTEDVKKKFGFENPMIDVREVDRPFLDASIVSNKIAKSIEKGINYKKVVHFYLDKIMEGGATGVQIRVGGKLGGEKSRFQKFRRGYITHSGEYSETLVDKGQSRAQLKLGAVGIEVKIMRQRPNEFELLKVEVKGEEKKAS